MAPHESAKDLNVAPGPLGRMAAFLLALDPAFDTENTEQIEEHGEPLHRAPSSP
jgi:hypothetical protein